MAVLAAVDLAWLAVWPPMVDLHGMACTVGTADCSWRERRSGWRRRPVLLVIRGFRIIHRASSLHSITHDTVIAQYPTRHGTVRGTACSGYRTLIAERVFARLVVVDHGQVRPTPEYSEYSTPRLRSSPTHAARATEPTGTISSRARQERTRLRCVAQHERTHRQLPPKQLVHVP